MKVAVSGATGFVGSALIERLEADARCVPLAMVRGPARDLGDVPVLPGCDLEAPDAGWPDLAGVEALVHLAGRAHVLHEDARDPLAAFRRVNSEGTVALARRAARAGVRRFVFLSSIGVLGRSSEHPFRLDDPSRPEDAYAVSKWEAEQGLWAVGRETGMEVVVVRAPLVYGPNAPGNFGRLMEWVARGVPLPLGAVNNRRTLVGLDNLADLLVRCLDYPAAGNGVFLAGDAEDLSTTELLRRVADALGRRARLAPVPPALLRAVARAVGRGEMARRLLDSLQVDIGPTRETLGWEPPLSVDEGLRRAAAPRRMGRPGARPGD